MSDQSHVPNSRHVSFKRFALGIEYNGSKYRGFQVQSSGVSTVQDELQKALTTIAAHPVEVVCAGRTDAGVHATGQVVHFDVPVSRPERAWILGGNSLLPIDISVSWAKSVSSKFHARFSARGRRYRYIIYNHPHRSAIAQLHSTWQPQFLNDIAMQEGARYLIGEHDFSSFRSSQCQASQPIRLLRELTVRRSGHWIIIEVEATAFLHNMVRNIVGVLYEVGLGKREPHWVVDVLNARDRTIAGVTAPTFGLYLVDVSYPSEFDIPRLAMGPNIFTLNI